jgi:hypothetical protein
MNRFEREFNRVLHEDMTAGDVVGGSDTGFNPKAGSITSSPETYGEPEDSRIATSIFGGALTRGGKVKCKKCKKGKKCKDCKGADKKTK